MPDPIYLDGNDYEVEKAITRRDEDTGEEEAADGLSSLTAHLSATDGGATIHASLSVSVSERASKPGTYFATFQGSDLTVQLAGYRRVWLVFGDGANVNTSDPVKVHAQRRSER